MSVEDFPGVSNNKVTMRERMSLSGRQTVAGLAVVGAIAGVGAGPAGMAEAAPRVPISALYEQADYSDTSVILVGGTDDSESMRMPGYEHFLPPGADAENPIRIRYPAQVFPSYDFSVQVAADAVYNIITQSPLDKRFVVLGHSQGGHAGWEGLARVSHDQPHRRPFLEFHSFGDPGHPWQGIFTVLPPLPGYTPRAPRPDIGIDSTYYCMEATRNDSVCKYEGDPFKAAVDWWNVHPQDKPDRFAYADSSRLITLPISPSVREVILYE